MSNVKTCPLSYQLNIRTVSITKGNHFGKRKLQSRSFIFLKRHVNQSLFRSSNEVLYCLSAFEKETLDSNYNLERDIIEKITFKYIQYTQFKYIFFWHGWLSWLRLCVCQLLLNVFHCKPKRTIMKTIRTFIFLCSILFFDCLLEWDKTF